MADIPDFERRVDTPDHPGDRIWRRIDDHEERLRSTETRLLSMEEKFRSHLSVTEEMRSEMRVIKDKLEANGAKLETLIHQNEKTHERLMNKVEAMTNTPIAVMKIIIGFGAVSGVLYGASKIIVRLVE